MLIPDYTPEKYPVSFEDIHFKGRITEAPLTWKVGQVIKYLHDHVFREIKIGVRQDLDLSSLLLTFAVVEYLSGYHAGEQSNKKHFIAFMRDFFPDRYLLFSKGIYQQLRNGLVHNLTLRNPWSSGEHEFVLENMSDDHLLPRNGKVVFSIRHYIHDVMIAHGLQSYILVMKVEEYPHLAKNFERRFNKQDGMSSTMIKIP